MTHARPRSLARPGALLALGLALGGCPICDDDPVLPESAMGERWTEADALFHQDPRWLGGDGAYSIDLGGDRSLWLFGDSFIATSDALTRRESTMVRNSIAVMTGRDPLTATMEFAWTDGTPPSSFFPEEGDHWFWPVHGVRLPEGPLFVFLAEERSTDGGLGFVGAGYRVVRIDNADAPPRDWTIESVEAPPAPHDPSATVGACTTIDGDHLVAVSVDGEQEHRGRLVRWPLDAVAVGDFSTPSWWGGDAWVDQSALAGSPAVVLADAGSECSLGLGPQGGWMYVASRGFGATTVAFRSAERLEGPWGGTHDGFRPPESDRDDAFVYAAKAHPQLSPHQLASEPVWDVVVTYADNSFTFEDLFDPQLEHTVYWPHFARLSFGQVLC